MSRIKSFAAPHKGLRYVISKFTVSLGHTDFQSPAQLSGLKQLGHEMFALLNDYVQAENEHTLTFLEARAPGTSEHDKADHERLEAVQISLERRLAGFTGNESRDMMHTFYLDFSMFQSQYLAHIFEEETVTELLLQQYFTDEELMQHRVGIMQKIPFPMLLLWMKYIIAGQRENESLGMLSAFKTNAPATAFEQVLASVRSEMDSERYTNLVSKLGPAV